MAALFASGRIADLILALLATEAVVLTFLRRPPPGAVLPFLAAGACLALALRAALVGAWWGWIALPLAGAGAAHVLDLRNRWRAAAAAARNRDGS